MATVMAEDGIRGRIEDEGKYKTFGSRESAVQELNLRFDDFLEEGRVDGTESGWEPDNAERLLIWLDLLGFATCLDLLDTEVFLDPLDFDAFRPSLGARIPGSSVSGILNRMGYTGCDSVSPDRYWLPESSCECDGAG